MKKFGRVLRIIFYAISAIALLVAAALMINPFLRSEAGIRNHLLRITPIGTSMEDVIRVADSNNGWTIRVIREEHGVVLHPRRLTPTGSSPTRDFPVVGEQSVRIFLGFHGFILKPAVTAFYAFDENGKLIEIFVRKEYDVI